MLRKMTQERGTLVERSGAGLHNFTWSYGDKDLEALIADIGEGVLIDRFLGSNSNGTTGKLGFGLWWSYDSRWQVSRTFDRG